jgi:hypothetical protein
MNPKLLTLLLLVTLAASTMTLKLQLAQASDIAVNSTQEIDVTDESITAEEFAAISDAEMAANDKVDEIFMSITTQEGLDVAEKECKYVTEMNPYKVLECFEKNKNRIK